MSSNENSGQSNGDRTESRRAYLHRLGAVGLLAGVAGVSATGRASGTPGVTGARGVSVTDAGRTLVEDVSRLELGEGLAGIENGDSVQLQATQAAVESNSSPSVVNVQSDLGVEPESDDVWGAIYEHYSSFQPTQRCHKYVIPCGTWHVETDSIHLDAHEYFGVVGDPYAVLRVTDPDVDLLTFVGSSDDSLPHAQRTEMKDLRVDIRGDVDAGIGRWYTYGYGHVENVEIRGRRDRRNPEYGGDRHTLKLSAIRPEATNVARNVRFNHGDTAYSEAAGPGHAIPFSAEPPHVGTNIWERCQATGFLDNGFYVSTSTGRNLIVSCLARNNAGANIRLGPDDVVLNSRIVMDAQPEQPWTGLWLQNGGGQSVMGLRCESTIQKSTEILRCTQDGPATISDLHIEDGGNGGRAIRIQTSGDGRTVFENCSIVDRTTPTAADYAVYVRSSRVTFRDCRFDVASQTGVDRNAIIVHSPSAPVDQLTIDDCEISADDVSLRFARNGADHNVTGTILRSRVTSDSGTTLSRVLWTGNRHYSPVALNGSQDDWQGDFNWGVDL
ncbi:right-handed parallel beta-helix repeat-containing protein [Natrononativus amylolyticus]|uniref:right-handed parallel beta-helix repeat-containing protein n=1 Tax=Natrononativus amylolyticus TaxID=2963434 RepID=UPI0020CE1D92|nr:right-handed parallel beta-helix repeat-containing protein [Natrononativus amylolyticus]